VLTSSLLQSLKPRAVRIKIFLFKGFEFVSVSDLVLGILVIWICFEFRISIFEFASLYF
jgi:hypothetical protein